MAYSYCRKCDAEMGEPSLSEVLNCDHTCTQCGHSNHPLKSDAEAILEMAERLEALENLVKTLTTGGDPK